MKWEMEFHKYDYATIFVRISTQERGQGGGVILENKWVDYSSCRREKENFLNHIFKADRFSCGKFLLAGFRAGLRFDALF